MYKGRRIYKNSLLNKGSALAIIILFIGLSAIPTAGNIIAEKDTPVINTSGEIHSISNILNLQASPSVQITGEKGDNNWFISCVLITFTIEPGVEEIWYRIDEDNYKKYTGPDEYCDEGAHVLHWYWIDPEGLEHQMAPKSFKIDQTPPNIELTKRNGLNDQKIFTANCEDDASEVERVEFYLDDILQDTITEAPYKWTWIGTEEHSVYAIGYNYAGLSQESTNLSTPHSYSYYSQFINLIFKIIYHIIF